MNGMNGKYEGPEVALVPYPIILAATKGDPEAMKVVVQHFSGYCKRAGRMRTRAERTCKKLFFPANRIIKPFFG